MCPPVQEVDALLNQSAHPNASLQIPTQIKKLKAVNFDILGR